MRLQEFERSGKGKRTRFAAVVPDATGAKSHELIVAGPGDVVQKALKDADFTLRITPGGTREEWERDLERTLQARREGASPASGLERVGDFFKKPSRPVTPANSVFMALRRVAGEGTGYWLSVALFVPTGWNFFFLLPPVCTCAGLLIPVSGDPDLFLTLNGTTTPTVAASFLPDGAWDRVSFSGACWPWTHFVPFFRVNGFVGGVCGFSWGGWGIF